MVSDWQIDERWCDELDWHLDGDELAEWCLVDELAEWHLDEVVWFTFDESDEGAGKNQE